jgi:hypothetical protein
MNNRFISFLLMLSAFAVHTHVHAATTAFDNMPASAYSSQVGRALYGPSLNGTTATWQGMQFTATTSGYLTSVLAPMTTAWNPKQTADVQLSLWSDGGSIPLGMIESSTAQVGSTFPAPVLGWNWQGTSFLQQGQSYWLVAQTYTPNATVSWQYVPGYLSTSAVTASTGGGQTAWTVYYGNGGEMAMSVMVNAVPEPEIYAMLLGGFGLLGWMTNRRKRA